MLDINELLGPVPYIHKNMTSGTRDPGSADSSRPRRSARIRAGLVDSFQNRAFCDISPIYLYLLTMISVVEHISDVITPVWCRQAGSSLSFPATHRPVPMNQHHTHCALLVALCAELNYACNRPTVCNDTNT